jgi:hypothetical protein
VLDEDINKRVATELGRRGRAAASVYALGLKGSSDPSLIEQLEVLRPGCVLVTGNDRMPEEHPSAVARGRIAIATIDPRRPPGMPQEFWRRDVVHRWADQMQRQEGGTVRRYSFRRSAPWKPIRRKARSDG